ncbi:MAG: ribosome maturation factor RimM [Acidobacteriota bacterium]
MSSRSPSSRRRSEPSSGPGDGGGIAVGRILRAHGIRGEVKVEVWSDVEGRFGVGREFALRRPRVAKASGALGAVLPKALCIRTCRADRGVLLVRFAGVADRDAAEALAGATLEIDESEVPTAPEGFYYFHQLTGCRVSDREAGDLGPVVEVVEDGGGHLLAVQTARGLALIPFVDAFLGRVDPEAGLIEVDLPQGLLESCTSPS